MSSTIPTIYPPMSLAAPMAMAAPPACSVLTMPLLGMKSAPELSLQVIPGSSGHVPGLFTVCRTWDVP
ncbi:hypothetical protein M404DRAFT_33362 [Pisolithus tinctorius Marx 270]|uniref:Uncharacterized protein n=1 Tax=Pisolithus tinctorius Marx 270 TaxID=870435 RepID=A0A0C3NL88_PISTI|nr:hypothetical protein M404DRAFT_33362 [Pisolithus tinctorius Marx 270]